jgi:hypothetical protein
MPHAELINYFAERFGFGRYLEIGVQAGVTFNAVRIASKTAVDPAFAIARDRLDGESFKMTSDAFFDQYPDAAFDFVFIDGLHTFEQSLRDFTRSLFRIPRTGLILIDDCFPSDYYASLRSFEACTNAKTSEKYPDRSWMGDVFKTILVIHDYFDSVSFAYIEGTLGVVAVWFEPRTIKPLFQTMEEIFRCDYAQFRYGIGPRLPRMTPVEAGDAIHRSQNPNLKAAAAAASLG